MRTSNGLSCKDLMVSKEMQIKKFIQEESITVSPHKIKFKDPDSSFQAGYAEGSRINLNFQKQIKKSS
jgi:hypothetical protein